MSLSNCIFMTQRKRHESTFEQVLVYGQKWVHSCLIRPAMFRIEIDRMDLVIDL